eukprot:Skav224797  [mRNA]  locus=scaffold764:550290:552649:- [translate_table: standard]
MTGSHTVSREAEEREEAGSLRKHFTRMVRCQRWAQIATGSPSRKSAETQVRDLRFNWEHALPAGRRLGKRSCASRQRFKDCPRESRDQGQCGGASSSARLDGAGYGDTGVLSRIHGMVAVVHGQEDAVVHGQDDAVSRPETPDSWEPVTPSKREG